MTITNRFERFERPDRPRPSPPTENSPFRQGAVSELGGGRVAMRADGMLLVSGTFQADQLQVARSGRDSVTVTLNGESRNFSGVRGVAIETASGDDHVVLDENLRGLDLDVSLGRGADRLTTARLSTDSFERGGGTAFSRFGDTPRVRVDAGGGSNHIDARPFDYAQLLGGEASDVIRAGDHANVDGRGGNDLVEAGVQARIRNPNGEDSVRAGDGAVIDTRPVDNTPPPRLPGPPTPREDRRQVDLTNLDPSLARREDGAARDDARRTLRALLRAGG